MIDNKLELVLSKSDNILDEIKKQIRTRRASCDDIYPKLNHKSFLQDILNVIKNIQMELLSKVCTSKKKNQFSKKEIINLLKNLKIDLNTSYQENLKTKTNIEHDTKMLRKCLANKIYNKSEKLNDIKKKENLNQFNYQKLNSEISELKSLNFKIENQIKCIDTKINILSSNKSNNKNTPKINYLFFEGRNPGIPLENLLHDNILNIRDKFKLIVKKKDFQNKVILQLSATVNLWKDEYKLQNKKYHNEYIITSQIINEESKDYPTKTSSFANDNYCDKEKINSNKIENDILYKGKLIYI
jgi:hypothetical protein